MMITRRGLFKGLFAVAGAVVLKPFVLKDKTIVGVDLGDKDYSKLSVRDRYLGYLVKWNEVLSLPFIDLSDGATGFVKYTLDESESWKDRHLRLTSDFREKGLDIILSDGGLIRLTNQGSWHKVYFTDPIGEDNG
jgi:hypothetical protein